MFESRKVGVHDWSPNKLLARFCLFVLPLVDFCWLFCEIYDRHYPSKNFIIGLKMAENVRGRKVAGRVASGDLLVPTAIQDLVDKIRGDKCERDIHIQSVGRSFLR